MIPYWGIYGQTKTAFQIQGCQMDVKYGNFELPISAMNMFNNVAILALVPLFDNGEVDIREQIQNCKLLPFKIPLDLKNKLRKLINYLGLKTGSIDLLVRNDGSFVFLEINPSGMFSQLSRKCNFGIEWEIIKYLN